MNEQVKLKITTVVFIFYLFTLKKVDSTTLAIAAKAEKAASLTSGVPSLRLYINQDIFFRHINEKP